MSTFARRVSRHLTTVVLALAVAVGVVGADAGVVVRPGELPVVRAN